MTKEINSNPQFLDQTKVIGLAKTIWDDRKLFIRITVLVTFFGILVAFLLPKEYVTYTTMVPQTSNPASKLGGISSLAAMAGFNLDMSSGDELSPAIFPQIVSSVPFQMEIMNAHFTVKNEDAPINLYDYYTKKNRLGIFHLIKEYTIGLPGKLIEAIKGETVNVIQDPLKPIALNRKQDKIRKLIAKQLTLGVDIKHGYLTLQSSFPEAELSAQVAAKASELLQKYITQFKIKKATDQFNFVEGRYFETKNEFIKQQENLARFRDQNKYLSTAMAVAEEERLRSEYSIALSVFNELAKQLEQAKIQVKENTPSFSIIEPPSVPVKAAKPKKVFVITLWLFLGVILGLTFVFGKTYLQNFWEKWDELSQNEKTIKTYT